MVCCLSFVINCLWLVVWGVIRCLLLVNGGWLLVTCCWLFVIGTILCVVCDLLFVIWVLRVAFGV